MLVLKPALAATYVPKECGSTDPRLFSIQTHRKGHVSNEGKSDPA